MATSTYTEDEMYFVQSQPLIQYGPLTLDQLKELYINEVVHDNTFIACSSSLTSFKQDKSTTTSHSNPFHIIPNEEPLWSPIHSMDTIFSELEEAMTPFIKSKRNNNTMATKSINKNNNNNTASSSTTNFQVNMNMNANNGVGGTMDINMNITNNHHNLTRKEMESQQFEISLLQQKKKTLSKLNKDLQKEIMLLKAKYQSQCIDLRTKMLKQFEDYKKQKQVT